MSEKTKEGSKIRDISKTISEKIAKKEIQMKPKYYFVLGTATLMGGVVFFLLLSVFFINLISHRLRVLKLANYFEMESYGRLMFLRHFPWEFLVVTLVFFVLGAYLLKKYEISYKKSFLVIVTSLAFSVLVAGVVADRIGFNRPFEKRPFTRGLYETRISGKDFVTGIITDVSGGIYLLETLDGNKTKVVFDGVTKFPLRKEFDVGSCIRALGAEKNDQNGQFIYAEAVMPCKPMPSVQSESHKRLEPRRQFFPHK